MLDEGAHAWLWPDPERTPWEHAAWLKRYPRGPTLPSPGEVLLVAVAGRCATLWAFGVRDADTEIGGEAIRAWDQARAVVLNRARLLWRSPARWASNPPKARKVAHFVPQGACEHPVTRVGGIDGASFGLAFVLAQASRIYDVPVGTRFAALAAVDADGCVTPVSHIRLKCEGVVHRAPSVRTLLVAPGNADEAREVASDMGVEVLSVRTAEEALKVVFGDQPETCLAERLADPRGRRTVTLSLFEMTLRGNPYVLNWRPVAEASSLALGHLTHPTPDETFRLRFAHAVALRHQYNRGDLPIPDDDTLSAMPAPVRLELLAHLVQHSADNGIPSADQVEQIARSHLVSGPQAFPEHLRLLGALCRLLAVTGRPEEAYELGIAAVEGFVERMAWTEVSRPLCMVLRLAGLLGREVEPFMLILQDLLDRDVLSERDRQYLDLARSANRVLCCKASMEDEMVLARLAENRSAPSHVRFSACRLAILAALTLGKSDEVARWHDVLHARCRDSSLTKDERHDARLFQALASLDRNPDDIDALAQLRDLDPGVVGHLTRAALNVGEPVGSYVRKYYPY